jgi:hypothetical protein
MCLDKLSINTLFQLFILFKPSFQDLVWLCFPFAKLPLLLLTLLTSTTPLLPRLAIAQTQSSHHSLSLSLSLPLSLSLFSSLSRMHRRGDPDRRRWRGGGRGCRGRRGSWQRWRWGVWRPSPVAGSMTESDVAGKSGHGGVSVEGLR